MSILDERELTDAERVAIDDEPRPGIWLQDSSGFHSGSMGGDARQLQQQQTDELILAELQLNHAVNEDDARDVVDQLRGCEYRYVYLDLPPASEGAKPIPFGASQQRGGVHSEPLVRLLAFRAWGDRDRRWRHPRDTARAFLIQRSDLTAPVLQAYHFDGLAMLDDVARRMFVVHAQRGDRSAEYMISARDLHADVHVELVLDALDRLAVKLDRGESKQLYDGPTTITFGR